ncbi:unnamed protein product [Schistocephalus solidus]|uniref:Secreted protein n=1 Tax=Schistocephalus solidus TaxID=70667 RepID=A0A183TQU8_SCHSO|nr:unnamed protein product [Schistocephalus solidus]
MPHQSPVALMALPPTPDPVSSLLACVLRLRWVAAPSQLHLPQHDVDAEDSGPLQNFHVRDPVLPSQLQYSAEAAEMKVIQLPGLVRVDGPGLRSVKECRQDDSLVHLQCGVQPAKRLTGFQGPLGNLVIDSRVAQQRAS